MGHKLNKITLIKITAQKVNGVKVGLNPNASWIFLQLLLVFIFRCAHYLIRAWSHRDQAIHYGQGNWRMNCYPY